MFTQNSSKNTIFYIVHQNGCGQRPRILQCEGGQLTYFSNFAHQASHQMLQNTINSKTNPSAVTNFPASSWEHLLFCQPARFLWGTNQVRNRFIGSPCICSTKKLYFEMTFLLPSSSSSLLKVPSDTLDADKRPLVRAVPRACFSKDRKTFTGLKSHF